MNWVKYVDSIRVWPYYGAEPHRVKLMLERRGSDTWALVRHPFHDVWDKNQCRFIYEPCPSNRDEDFLCNCRFVLSDAYTVAMRIIRDTDRCMALLDLDLIDPVDIELCIKSAHDLRELIQETTTIQVKKEIL